MRLRTLGYQVASLGIAVQLCCVNTARGDVISTSSTLPVFDGTYIAAGGTDCFLAAGLCLTAGGVTLAPPVSVTFDPSEDIVSDAIFTGQLSTIGGTPLGPVSLMGTVEQEVTGRLAATGTGSWTTVLQSLSLSGSGAGHTLTLSLDGSHTSDGTTAIVPSGPDFLISSFFDVFVDLGVDTSPLATGSGPIHLDAVPEPVSLFVLIPAALALLAARRRFSARV